MRGQHDLGGMPAGPIDTNDHVTAPWAKLITAIVGAIRSRGYLTIDEMRCCLEGLPEDVYNQPYFERWAEALCNILEDKDIVTRQEVENRMAQIAARRGHGGHRT